MLLAKLIPANPPPTTTIRGRPISGTDSFFLRAARFFAIGTARVELGGRYAIAIYRLAADGNRRNDHPTMIRLATVLFLFLSLGPFGAESAFSNTSEVPS